MEDNADSEHLVQRASPSRMTHGVAGAGKQITGRRQKRDQRECRLGTLGQARVTSRSGTRNGIRHPICRRSPLPGGDVHTAHPAWGQRDILVVYGRLPPEAVAERDVQPAVEAARHSLPFQKRPVVPDEVFRRAVAPRWDLRTRRRAPRARRMNQTQIRVHLSAGKGDVFAVLVAQDTSDKMKIPFCGSTQPFRRSPPCCCHSSLNARLFSPKNCNMPAKLPLAKVVQVV